ncbi:MAG: hypothetical protein GQ557_00835 [Mycoplasmataceae bacterium]|nr:hypothetical protein [Mycoplasmataceae bacterium]
MAFKEDKGFLTRLFTLITLFLSLAWTAAMFSLAFISIEISLWALILGIIALIAVIYLWIHGIKILIGVEKNTYLFVFMGLISSGLVGGILMLIAKWVE